MNVELCLIKRPKLSGPGEHYGVRVGNEVVDFHDHYKVTTIEDFSKNNFYKVVEETKAIVPLQEAKERFKDLQNYKYDLFTKNCEHWARRMVEGKFLSTQINSVLLITALAGFIYVASKKAA